MKNCITGGNRGKQGETDRGRIMARARSYVGSMPVSIAGSNGHGALLSVTCRLWNGFALSEEDTMEILREFSARCLPPWEEKELRHKVEQVSSGKVLQKEPRGYLLDQRRDRIPHPASVTVPKSESVTIKIVPKALPQKCLAAPPAQNAADRQQPVPTDDLVMIPGCRVPKPIEIEVTDDTWRAVEASGLAEEPIVQFALQMFGPGCQVISETVHPPSQNH